MNSTQLQLDDANVNFFKRARWFGHKGSKIDEIALVDWLDMSDSLRLGVYRVGLRGGAKELYLSLFDSSTNRPVELDRDCFQDFFYSNLNSSSVRDMNSGKLVFRKFGDVRFDGQAEYDLLPLVSSNTLMLRQQDGKIATVTKFIRRLQAGESVEAEMNAHIFADKDFNAAPRYFGSVEYVDADGIEYNMATVFDYVENDGNAWDATLGWMANFIEGGVKSGFSEEYTAEQRARYERWAGELGRVLASLHIALSKDGEGAFGILPAKKEDVDLWRKNWLSQFDRTFSDMKKSTMSIDSLSQVLSMEDDIRGTFEASDEVFLKLGAKIRQHGDFHLGQLLVKGDDFYIIDFEGEPLKAYDERAIHYPALKDVAGVVRSFNYAAFSAYFDAREKCEEKRIQSEIKKNCMAWEGWAREAFLSGYFAKLGEVRAEFIPLDDKDTIEAALKVMIMDKALYEVEYEINNRPDWLMIPLGGILNIMEAK